MIDQVPVKVASKGYMKFKRNKSRTMKIRNILCLGLCLYAIRFFLSQLDPSPSLFIQNNYEYQNNYTTLEDVNQVYSQGNYQLSQTDGKEPLDEFLQTKLPLKSYSRYEYDFPCATTNETQNGEGIIFIKVHKCASTTVAKLVREIANKRGRCGYHNKHGPAHTLDLKNRKRSKSYLFTFLRHPSSRYVSQFRETMLSQL